MADDLEERLADVEVRLARVEERLDAGGAVMDGLAEDIRELGDREREGRNELRDSIAELVRAGDEVILERIGTLHERGDRHRREILEVKEAVSADREARKREREQRAKDRATIAVAVIGASATVLAAIIAAVVAIIQATGG